MVAHFALILFRTNKKTDFFSQVILIPLESTPKENQPLPSTRDTFAQWFKVDTFADVKLITKDKEFSAHKFILAKQSPVLAHMLEHKMTNDRLQIEDVDSVEFDKMLEFIYCGNVSLLNQFAVKLLPLAHKVLFD